MFKQMYDDGKLVAAICHAGWMLASAGILSGRKITSYFFRFVRVKLTQQSIK